MALSITYGLCFSKLDYGVKFFSITYPLWLGDFVALSVFTFGSSSSCLPPQSSLLFFFEPVKTFTRGFFITLVAPRTDKLAVLDAWNRLHRQFCFNFLFS